MIEDLKRLKKRYEEGDGAWGDGCKKIELNGGVRRELWDWVCKQGEVEWAQFLIQKEVWGEGTLRLEEEGWSAFREACEKDRGGKLVQWMMNDTEIEKQGQKRVKSESQISGGFWRACISNNLEVMKAIVKKEERKAAINRKEIIHHGKVDPRGIVGACSMDDGGVCNEKNAKNAGAFGEKSKGKRLLESKRGKGMLIESV